MRDVRENVCGWLIPELNQRRCQKEQRDDEILGRFGLLSAENQKPSPATKPPRTSTLTHEAYSRVSTSSLRVRRRRVFFEARPRLIS